MTPERLAEMMARATRPRRTVPIILDGELQQQIQELAFELEAIDPAKAETDRRLSSKAKTSSRIASIERELDELYERAEESTLQVVIEGLPGTPWAALKASHQPPREGVQADKLWGFNLETGRPQLIRATIVGQRETDGTVTPIATETVDWLLAWATDWQADKLLIAALEMTRGDDAVPLRRRPSATQTSDAG